MSEWKRYRDPAVPTQERVITQIHDEVAGRNREIPAATERPRAPNQRARRSRWPRGSIAAGALVAAAMSALGRGFQRRSARRRSLRRSALAAGGAVVLGIGLMAAALGVGRPHPERHRRRVV